MNMKRTSIFAAAIAIAAAALPLTAAAHDRWDRGWRGNGYGHGHHQRWNNYYAPPRPVVVPAPVYAYPRYVPAPVYAPPPTPVVYPPVGFTFIWNGGW